MPFFDAIRLALRTIRTQKLKSAFTLLGVCIGMQVLFERSEEGDVAGLGLLRGQVRKLPASPGIRLPHMGWNRLARRVDSPLLEGIEEGA